LERLIKASKVFLKFEGINPTGTQKDRISSAHIKTAKGQEYGVVTAGTCGNYGVSMAYFSHIFGLKSVIYIPRGYRTTRIDEMLRYGAEIVGVDGGYEDAVAISTKAAHDNEWYDANPGVKNAKINFKGYANIAYEIVHELGHAPTAVGVPVGNGTTLAGVYHGFKEMHTKGLIDRMPKMVAASTVYGNPVIESFKDGLNHLKLIPPTKIKETPINEPLVAYNAFDGDEALKALWDSEGYADYVSDSKMLIYSRFLRRYRVDALPASTSPIEALRRLLLKVKLGSNYVIVLTGRRPWKRL